MLISTHTFRINKKMLDIVLYTKKSWHLFSTLPDYQRTECIIKISSIFTTILCKISMVVSFGLHRRLSDLLKAMWVWGLRLWCHPDSLSWVCTPHTTLRGGCDTATVQRRNKETSGEENGFQRNPVIVEGTEEERKDVDSLEKCFRYVTHHTKYATAGVPLYNSPQSET